MSVIKFKKNATKIDNFLIRYLKKQRKTNLIQPMKYGILNGGKKIRSTIILDTGKIFNLDPRKLINLCAAVECIHSYSLIHDDLPCMDDDKIRRGKPSTHIRYGESTAVLAGNSLLTLGFELLSDRNYLIKDGIKNKLIKNLALCSGHSGIAGGQQLDLSFEKKRKSLKQILDMQRKKTGKLFNFCCFAPTLIANKDNKDLKNMSSLGEDIGLLFQISDDLLDLTGSKKKIGKPTKQDRKKGKSTLISLIGFKETLNYALKIKYNILKQLNKYGKKSESLKKTVKFILERNF
ncbi:MAG: geranyl transferase [Candidatus Pelagibacter sp.]|nr:geranyl transferase [Candidatus Pelagibacter sp.]OUW23891.1 MAG: geranyl transferase [Rickettsiales bacterium TMED174]|tara:strand:+ start:837 stop:1712 length:876 start_codon:yes stop_codon:yes gene_type:complete